VKKSLAVAAAAVLATASLGAIGSPVGAVPTQAASSKSPTPRVPTPRVPTPRVPTPRVPSAAEAVARAGGALAAHRGAVLASPSDAFAAQRSVIDPDGASHVRYQRTYRGVPVLGGDLVVHLTPGGTFRAADVAQSRVLTLATTARLPASAATAAARRAFTGSVAGSGTPRLVVDAHRATPALAWETVVSGMKPDGQTPSRLHVLTDAATGAVLGVDDEIETVDGTGRSIYSGSVRISTSTATGGYSMVDPTHGSNRTCDLGGKTSGTCTTFTDADNVWGTGTTASRQSAAVDAHYGAAATFDYYRNVLGRNGIFNTGRGVPSRVHYGRSYVNAFWDGTQMTYGDGYRNADPLTELDIAGHEMSHGVTENTAGLTYSGESGGLNEATSDIFGTMVEFYANNAADPGDYTVGEKVDINGNGTPLRWMYQPSKDGASPNCWYSGVGNLDVHYSSGIGNHFYYLFAEGSRGAYGTSPTCGAPAVTGVGRTAAAKIYYRALAVYMTSSTTYARARTATLSAAADLYGTCSTQQKAVNAAWAGTGVKGTLSCA